MSKKLIVVAASVIIAIYIAHVGALYFLSHDPSCSMPCSWSEGKGYGDCSPLETRLEIKTTPEPTGRGTAVWYRAEITNRSCQILKIRSDFFLTNKSAVAQIDSGLGARLVITDSHGRIVPAAGPEGTASTGADAAAQEIHPYRMDSKAIIPLAETNFSQRDPTYFSEDIALPPGATAATSPSILEPYRLEARTVATERWVGTGLVPTPVVIQDAAKHYAVPPAGFRRLTEYRLTSPGKYLARLRIDEPLGIAFSTGKGGTTAHFIRMALKYAAHPLSPNSILGIDFHSESKSSEFVIQ
jgi:hypothetical protein